MTDSTLTRGSSPPTWPLVLSMVGALGSAALVWPGLPAMWSPEFWYAIGWLAGALVPMMSTVCYQLRVRTLRSRPDFSFTRWDRRWMVITALAGAVAGMWHGYHFAFWWAT